MGRMGGMMGPPPGPAIRFNDLKRIGDRNQIEVVDYDTFYRDLDDVDKPTAPPRRGGPPVFCLINHRTHRPRVVLIAPMVDERMAGFIIHMLTHENIHITQWNRKKADYDTRGMDMPGETLPDPNDKKAYMSDQREIMAYSHSITDILVREEGCRTMTEAVRKLKNNMIWKDVIKHCDEKVIKKYKKYIFLYLEKEFAKKKQTAKKEDVPVAKSTPTSGKVECIKDKDSDGLKKGTKYHVKKVGDFFNISDDTKVVSKMTSSIFAKYFGSVPASKEEPRKESPFAKKEEPKKPEFKRPTPPRGLDEFKPKKEEQKKSSGIDYSKMSQALLKREMDKALDSLNFEEAHEINKFLK